LTELLAGVARAALLELVMEHGALDTRIAIAAATLATLPVLDALLELDDAVEQRLRARRATGHVHVDGDDAVDALNDRVVVEDAPARGAVAHGDDPLGVGHLVINLAQHGRHLLRDAAAHDHEVGLPRRSAEELAAEARDVELAAARAHHLDGAAREAERR